MTVAVQPNIATRVCPHVCMCVRHGVWVRTCICTCARVCTSLRIHVCFYIAQDIDLRWNLISDKLSSVGYRCTWWGKGHTGTQLSSVEHTLTESDSSS